MPGHRGPADGLAPTGCTERVRPKNYPVYLFWNEDRLRVRRKLTQIQKKLHPVNACLQQSEQWQTFDMTLLNNQTQKCGRN